MLKTKLLLLMIFFISSICFANNQVVYFEPKDTTITGVITELTFPGPPNYESIQKGDKAEKGAYLILKNPVDIAPVQNEKKFGNDKPTKNVQVVQLVVLNDKDWNAIKKGNYVQVRGKLSSPMTGHHHARALMDVKHVKIISKQKISNNQLNVTNEDKYLLKNQKD